MSVLTIYLFLFRLSIKVGHADVKTVPTESDKINKIELNFEVAEVLTRTSCFGEVVFTTLGLFILLVSM